MGKKVKSEKENIELNLEIQMKLAEYLSERNPKLKLLLKKYPRRFSDFVKNAPNESKYKEFDTAFRETYGDIFPFSPRPVQRVNKHEKGPSELLLRIDLNYTKDEILHCLEGWVSGIKTEYKTKHPAKYHRKPLKKWQTYLEIWDLRNGESPWLDVGGGLKEPPAANSGEKRPWTYEEIAKYLHPKAQEPEELKKATDKVKKQYRAAYELVCGEKYNPRKSEKVVGQFHQQDENAPGLCSTCPEREYCDDECEALKDFHAKFDVKPVGL